MGKGRTRMPGDLSRAHRLNEGAILMACRGVYFALSDLESQQLLGATHAVVVVFIIKEEIEERWNKEWLQAADKSWDSIHRCLTDGSLNCKGTSVLEKFVLGGKQLYDENDYIVSYLTPDDVVEVSSAATAITKEWFRQRYFGLIKSDYDGRIDEQTFEYSWTYFDNIRTFLQKAAMARRPVIFTVDQ
jgi:hypothetical protein